MAQDEAKGPTGGVSPHITILEGRGDDAIAFYKEAFGAQEAMPPMRAAGVPGMRPDDQRIMHAHLRINGGSVMLNDAFPEYTEGADDHGAKPAHTTLHLQVDDADRWWKRAIEAGAETTMPLDDQFWGDRYGQVRDPFGHSWSIGSAARNKEDGQ